MAALLLAASSAGPAAAQGAPPRSGAPASDAASRLAAGRLWVAPADVPGASAEELRQRTRRNVVNLVKLGLALAGTALLLWGAVLRRAGRPDAHRVARDRLLAALGAAGLLGWWNFGLFHYPDFVHAHELFHYTLGAKYFPELGYTRLYECVAVADAQDGLGARVARRRMTDLESYALVGTTAILSQPRRCTRHFSAERWALFRGDVAWFRTRTPPERWEALQRDHGYNPSPAWGILGRGLAGSGPLTEQRLATLVLIDPLLALLMWAFVWWSFGWRAGCVALLYWGTNHPAEYGWIGGSYLRADWLVASVAGICLLRRDQPASAGFLLASAALLRVFPALLLLPIAVEALRRMLRERRLQLSASHRRLAAGALLAACVLLPLSLASGGGARAWSDFSANLSLHAGSPSSNAVGLKTLLSHGADAREAVLQERDDPSQAWKEARRRNFTARWPFFGLLAAGFLALTARAARAQPDWVAAILGVGLIPVLLEPSSYYTTVFLAYALLGTRHPGIGAALCALAAAGWLCAAPWIHWDDVFAATSAVLLAFVALAALLVVRRREGVGR